MSTAIRWGILSTAQIGENAVIPAIHHSSNGEVVAVASRTLDRAQSFAQANDIPRAYGTYGELLADPDVDAIYNPLPNNMHAEWSIKAAEAGKAVLCEKPLASNAEEAQQMVNAFADLGQLLAEAFMYRYHPRTVRVKELVDDGAVGEVQFIQADFTFPIASEDNIRIQPGMAGGALMDVGCYCINVMRFMTGEEPDRVSGIGEFGEASGVDESLVGALGFPSGVLGVLTCGMRSPLRQAYTIRGTEGNIYVDPAYGPGADSAAPVQIRRGDSVQTLTFQPVDQYQLMVEDFAGALLTGGQPRFTVADAVANMRVIDRMLASARAANS